LTDTTRTLVWEGLDAWRAEIVRVELTSDGLRATGTQIGVEPVVYRLDYVLEAGERFVTRALEVEATGAGWRRRIEVRHDGRGCWSCDGEAEGDHEFDEPPGGSVEGLSEALDCDLGLSPLTNFMPLRRHGFFEAEGAGELTMAFVSVPELGLHASAQRYEHVRRDRGGSVVRYVDLGVHSGIESELVLDLEGFVVLYPGLPRSAGAAAVSAKRG